MDGKITAKTTAKIRDFDPLTGEVLDTRPSGSNGIGTSSEFYKVGEYGIDLETDWKDNGLSSCNINVIAPDGTVTTVELNELDSSVYASAVLELNDTTALIPVSSNKGYVFYELDLPTGKLTTGKEKDYEWLNVDDLGTTIVGTDGFVYTRNTIGISRIDAKEKTMEEVFNYSWCGINRGVIEGLVFMECSGDSIILLGQTKPSSIYESAPSDFQIVELTKAGKNPNAGKAVLELYTENMDEVLGAAIAKFNETNKKYFIVISDRYDAGDYVDTAFSMKQHSDDEWEEYQLGVYSKMSNALAMDIMNGEGPDILINTSKYGQLNNSACLADLTPYVKDLDPDSYFTNIIEGSKTGDAIYQLPVSFSIFGLYTDAKEAGSSGVGFTLDEYTSFVSGACNGTDLLLEGQAVYFSGLFNSMRDTFIKDGKADFSGPEFAALADYVKTNVPERSPGWEVITEQTYNYVDLFSCNGIGSFYHMRTGMINDPTILGTPSLDGRGPMFNSQFSVAVSSQAPDINACGEFVKILLSDEIKTAIAMGDNFVLNKSSFRSAAEVANIYYNNGGSMCSNGGGSTPYNGGKKFSTENIDSVECIIRSCTRLRSKDADISIILIEEMPAYFLGQKSLDAVIKITQNRAQKVLDERG